MENLYMTILTNDYIEALAAVANYLNDFEEEDREFAFEDLDDAVWAYAEENDIDTDQLLRIFTGIQEAILF